MKTKILITAIWLLMAVNANSQRNTIIIIADDLGTDYFGFYENAADTVDVPNIRSLLSKGVRFKFLMSNPVCSSTRSTILTGRYSFRTGVGGVVGGIGGSNQIDTAEISIPKLLKIYDPKIAKANIGKWHLKQPTPAVNLTSPLALGYDWSEGPFIGQLPSFTNWTKYTNGVASNVTTYATTENVNNAVTWLKAQKKGSPFFLWLAFNAPHEPLHLPPAALHSYSSLSGTAANINSQPKAYFKAMIQAMDHEIGRLFDTLRSMNKFDSTDIIFMGDNGNSPRTAQISDLRKAKGTIYDYGVNVPLIIGGPAVVKPGRSSNALVNTTDLFGTIVENFGFTGWQVRIPTAKPVDSRSLLPILKNQTDSVRPWTFSEIFKLTTDSADGKAIRNKNYHLIRFDYGGEEFYNISKDRLENTNLLKNSLNATDVSNYNYLCNELNKLLSSNSYCTGSVNLENTTPSADDFFQVFPNPSGGQIELRFNSTLPDFIRIEIWDALGRKLYSKEHIETRQNFTVQCSEFPAGMYSIRLYSGNKTAVKNVVLN
jgi:arylsulfatase A-like enzyme